MKTKEYKGFIGYFFYIKEEDYYFGKIANITDLITFQSDNESDMQKQFEEAVHDYLELCKEACKEPSFKNIA